MRVAKVQHNVNITIFFIFTFKFSLSVMRIYLYFGNHHSFSAEHMVRVLIFWQKNNN